MAKALSETIRVGKFSGPLRKWGGGASEAKQVEDGRKTVPIVCVQNQYNLAQREDDALVDTLARDGVTAFTVVFKILPELARGGGPPTKSVVEGRCVVPPYPSVTRFQRAPPPRDKLGED